MDDETQLVSDGDGLAVKVSRGPSSASSPPRGCPPPTLGCLASTRS